MPAYHMSNEDIKNDPLRDDTFRLFVSFFKL